jgi:hypothetical protein
MEATLSVFSDNHELIDSIMEKAGMAHPASMRDLA